MGRKGKIVLNYFTNVIHDFSRYAETQTKDRFTTG